MFAAEPSTQDGLPPELTIAAKPPLQTQLVDLQAMLAVAQQKRAPSGVLDGLRGLFTGGGKAVPVPPNEFSANITSLQGRLVSVSGLYASLGAGKGQFVYDGGTCPVTLPTGVTTEGVGLDGLDGKPLTIEGVAEANGLQGQLRATKVTPCPWLVLVRLARVCEEMGQYAQAEQYYEKASPAATAARSPLAAFAKTSAARIAFDELRDSKKAKNYYAACWNPFTGVDRRGKPQYYTWMPQSDGAGWEKLSVTDAISKPLDTLASNGIWYRVMAFFVDLSGGNRWIGILLISVLSRLLIWPLTKKQLSSAEAMKRLQPQIKALQERYVDDKQKFQEEFWRLCQANGVNPLGGCLPMVIQLPILIVLWQGIRDYIVQFNGHSFLWVHNLAAPDTPLLVAYTISMIFFQKMTQKLQPNPTMTEQQQQQQQMMTYMMPLMFFFFFKGFPAAFLLYWLATNIVYFAQQYLYTRGQAKREAADGTATLVVEAERSAGSPKSSEGEAATSERKSATGGERGKSGPSNASQSAGKPGGKHRK